MGKMRKRNRTSLQKPLRKKALIIGITGQDGIYLSKLLQKKKYNIIGSTRNLFKAKKKLKERGLKNIKIFKENFYSLSKTIKFINKIKPSCIFF